MTSAFIATANKLLANYEPRCASFTFDPHRPFGQIIGDLGEPLLNLGVAGVLFITNIAGECTDADVERVFHLSGDREEFWRWARSLKHTFDETTPPTAEQRALVAMDEQANADLYRILGLTVPPSETVTTHH